MKKEPKWIPISTFGSQFEEELDVNAAPETLADVKFRHRPVSFTGQEIPEWRKGMAPAMGDK